MRICLGVAMLLAVECRGEVLVPVAAVAASSAQTCLEGEVRMDTLCLNAEQAYVRDGGQTYIVDASHSLASDQNPGTAELPWQTISRAARAGALRPGDAVLIRKGVYRESVRPASGGTGPNARVTYAAYPGETVVISGADRADAGWNRQPDGTWRRLWDGPPLPTYSDDPVFRRELVVAAGRVLQPVAERSEVRPNSFWVEGPDTAPVAVIVRFADDQAPSDAGPIEIATRHRLFYPVGDDPYAHCDDPSAPSWIRVVGLTLRHAANRAQWGALCAGSEGGLVEDVRVEWTIGMGVDGSGIGHVFRRVQSDNHGQAGWGASCVSCVFEDGSAVGNNWRGHDLFWEAGGGKWNGTQDTIIRGYLVAENDGPGIWLDGDNRNNTIEDCLVVGNEGAGIMLELATTETLVQNNVVRGTRWRDWTGTGILSQAASRNVLLHNTIVDNEGTGIWIRLDPLRRAPDGDNQIINNWILGNARGRTHEAREIAIEGDDLTSVRSNRLDGNAYGAPDGDPVLRSSFFASTPPGGEAYRGSDLDTWRRVLRGDRHAIRLSNSSDRKVRSPESTSISGAPGASESRPQQQVYIGANNGME